MDITPGRVTSIIHRLRRRGYGRRAIWGVMDLCRAEPQEHGGQDDKPRSGEEVTAHQNRWFVVVWRSRVEDDKLT